MHADFEDHGDPEGVVRMLVGCTEVVKLLVGAGASLGARDNEGRTPLGAAAAENNELACLAMAVSGLWRRRALAGYGWSS